MRRDVVFLLMRENPENGVSEYLCEAPADEYEWRSKFATEACLAVMGEKAALRILREVAEENVDYWCVPLVPEGSGSKNYQLALTMKLTLVEVS